MQSNDEFMAVARNFIWGREAQCGGGQTSGRRNFCFEMVHFGAKLTNAVHHHWVAWERVTVKKDPLKTDQIILS